MAIKFIRGILLLTILGALVYGVQQKAYNQNKAAPATCNKKIDDECVDSPANTKAGNLKKGVNPQTNEPISQTEVNTACQAPVYLTVKYDRTDCIAGRPCDSLAPRTAVGWVGDSAGEPFAYYANSVRIPLTNNDGFWIHDNPLYRTSPKVNGLGLTRLGDGRVIVTHQNSDKTLTDYYQTKTFQAIDASMTVSGATVKNFIDGDLNIAPDQPTSSGAIVGHGVEWAFDNKISTAPAFTNLRPEIGPCGGDEIAWKEQSSAWKHYTRTCWPGDDYVMTLTCPAKPAAVACNLYPIALNKTSVENAKSGDVISDIWNGAGSGSFGWLTWAGNQGEPALSTSLNPPGNSSTYVNPNNANDHVVSIGDWILSRPGVSNSQGVRTALDKLKTVDIIVPVWNENTCQGGNKTRYKTWKYAKVRLSSYDLAGGPDTGPAGACKEKPGRNKITATFKEFVNCAQ